LIETEQQGKKDFSMKTHKHSLVRLFGLLPYLALCASALLFASCGGGGKGDIKASVKKELDRGFLAERPVELTNVSINWKRTTSLMDAIKFNKVEGSGTFSATGKTTEGFYESVGTEYGLRKLGITDTCESEFNNAKKEVDKVSRDYETDLRNDFPYERPEFPVFYEARVLKGEKVTLTGTIELVKHDKSDWQVREVKVVLFSMDDDEKKFLRESKLSVKVCKLDDPKAKDTVNAIIQQRKDFVGKVKSGLPKKIEN